MQNREGSGEIIVRKLRLGVVEGGIYMKQMCGANVWKIEF